VTRVTRYRELDVRAMDFGFIAITLPRGQTPGSTQEDS
jgi:hypothetical protein